MEKDFLEAVEAGPFVFDGAVGTQLYDRGIYINKSFDDANLSQQDLVRSVHEDYLKAGAEAITTNTFGSNRIKLKRHGLEDKVVAINRQGVELARQAAGQMAYVAGSVGPTGRTPTMLTDAELDEIREAYREQIGALADAGADVIVLETFRQLSEIKIALVAAREVCNLPVVAQMAFDAELRTGDGAEPERVALLLTEWGADVIGANCMEGPNVVYDVVEKMVGRGRPVIAQPNAGYPRKIEERLVYMANPEYFGVYARRFYKLGVNIVGGCCGTGPEHIERIAAAARMMGGGRVSVEASESKPDEEVGAEALEPVPVAERTALADKLTRVQRERVEAPPSERPPVDRDNFVVSVEVNPPSGLDPDDSIASAQMLIDGGVDVINTSDGPRASVRMNNGAFAALMRERVDCEVIVHYCSRDRNLLGLQADLLGLHVLGLHNLCVITGDPPKVGDYPHATAVFDLDSIGLLRMIDNFNRGLDPSGKSIGETTRFFCACGAEPAARDYEREIRRLEQKQEAGAHFVMTQPVYDQRVLETFLEDIDHLDLPVLVGLLPLASHRNAEFLHNEVPGMAVPDDIRKRMKAAGSGPTARAEGVAIAQETLELVKDDVVGAYIMPPFGRYEAALEILQCIDGYEPPPEGDES
ncbi:MAG: bifunctional homocysteine S-methyltransferase/methylenetetrahydrofolate reductase [Persicimonas sp.]